MSRALLFAGALFLTACARQEPLPVYGQVPDFVLTAQDGREFHGASLRGRIWVADFIFTNCTGPCPRMTAQMKWVQKQTAAMPNVDLVSFTIDPARDTPEVLADYARKFQAEPQRWHFLTGAQPVLHQLNRYAFKLGDVNGALAHSTRFVLVDQQGRVRGYYGTDEEDGLKPLLGDIRCLAGESTS